MKRQITCLLAVCAPVRLRPDREADGRHQAHRAGADCGDRHRGPGAEDPRRHSGYQNDDPVLHGCGQYEFRREI